MADESGEGYPSLPQKPFGTEQEYNHAAEVSMLTSNEKRKFTRAEKFVDAFDVLLHNENFDFVTFWKYSHRLKEEAKIIERALYSENTRKSLLLLDTIAHFEVPEFSQIALDIIERNTPRISESIDDFWHINFIPLQAFANLVDFGTPSQKETGSKMLQKHEVAIKMGLDHKSYIERYFPILLSILSYAEGEQYQHAVEQTESILNDGEVSNELKIDLMSALLADEHPKAQRLGKNAISEKLQGTGLNSEKAISAWLVSAKLHPKKRGEISLSNAIRHNLMAIDKIGEARPEACRILQEEFNINDFYRYPQPVLIEQYDQRDRTDLPYGVVFFPKNDHNSAFYQQNQMFLMLFEQLGDRYALRIAEGESKIEIIMLLRKLDRKYGEHHKISFAILGGHGNPNGILFGGTEEKHKLKTEDLVDPRAAKTSRYFVEHPTIILSSCSTGFNAGIGQELSKVLHARVIAPDKDSALKYIEAKIGENGDLDFQVGFSHETQSIYYAQGKNLEP